MKKKLIAALTSAAMVATMVPATAFATTTPSANETPKAKVTQAKATVYTAKDDWTAAWGEVKDLNPETLPFSTSIDADIEAAATAYIAAVDLAPVPVEIVEADSQK
ncbi:MAG: hypothetical protein ACLUOI_28760, partial [Eisenbergiella sp.]